MLQGFHVAAWHVSLHASALTQHIDKICITYPRNGGKKRWVDEAEPLPPFSVLLDDLQKEKCSAE